ncbi:hypothetical protein [Saltatorellus ferox]|uniref:hypothetical protein n=1 Tax=Saltatorellus ferox TaxID=2528018 RepID=UPI003AF35698
MPKLRREEEDALRRAVLALDDNLAEVVLSKLAGHGMEEDCEKVRLGAVAALLPDD